MEKSTQCMICTSSINIIRVVKSRRICLGERRDAYSILVRNPKGETSLGRPRCRWECNIKMNSHEVGCGSMERIDLSQDSVWWWAFLNAVKNLCVP